MENWKKKSKRFVLFFDIMGFKDMVARNSHGFVEKKLKTLTEHLERIPKEIKFPNIKIERNQTKPISFSDSILIFSRGNQKRDIDKILMDAHRIQLISLRNQIPIKGAISYGDITVDFEKSIFFGQPIIDAFLLHEELQILSVVIDHNATKRINDFKTDPRTGYNLYTGEVPMRYGKVNHTLLRLSDKSITEGITKLNKLYLTVSGKPRIYIDNTLSIYDELQKNIEI